jgi:predicted nucleotidyltransferase
MNITDETFVKAADIARRFGAKRLLVFGSAVNANQEVRDVDFACEGVVGWKLFHFGAALEEALHIPVDVVPLDEPTEFAKLIELQGRRIL